MVDVVSQFLAVIDRLLSVPAPEPDDARRRKLLNVLLLCTVVFTVLVLSPLAVAAFFGVLPHFHDSRLPSLGVPAILYSTAVIYVINRFWSGRLASVLFLLLVTGAVFASQLQSTVIGDDRAAQSGGSMAFAAVIVLAGVLLPSYASLAFAALISILTAIVALGVYRASPSVPTTVVFFVIAFLSWLVTHNLEQALADLRVANEELDQRVAERTRALQRRSVQLQTASEVARDATATLDVGSLLHETVQLISERFGFYHVGIFLTDERGEYAVLGAASSEAGERLLERGHRLAVGKAGIVGHVAGTGEPFVAMDVSQEAAYVLSPDLPDTRSQMALPLVSRGRVIGVLDIQSTQKAVFVEDDVAALQTVADQLANAVENAGLYAAEQQRRREAETLYRATQALATTLDLHRVFEFILSELQQVVAYDSASVQLLQDGRLEVIGGHGFPNPDELLGVTFDLSGDDNPSQEVVRRREAVIVDDASAVYQEFRRGPHAAIGIRSWLGVPLLLGDKLIGMLALDKREPGYYTSEHARLASAFAAQAAIAIENARLYEETRRHVEELTALHNIDVAITSTLNPDEVLQIICEQVRELTDATGFYIALYDESKDEIDVRLVVDRGKTLSPFRLNAEEESGLVGWVVRTRQSVWVADVEEEQDRLPAEPLVIGGPMRSLMVLPLVVRDQVVGVISAQSPEPGAYGEDDRQLMSGIAHQAAIAIANARLYEEARGRLAEALLIQEVTLAAASTLDFDLVLERTVKALYRALGIDCIGFLLPDEPRGMLVCHPSLVGFSESYVPIEGSLAGQVYRTGRPVLARQGAEGPMYVDETGAARSALAVPVWVSGRIVAVLHTESSRDGAFGEDELRVLSTVAGQLGVSLEHARLYEGMTRRTRDLRLLADASVGMVGSLEPQNIVDHMLTTLVERFASPCFVLLVEPDGRSARLAASWMPQGQSPPLPIGHELRISEWGGLSQMAETRHLVYVSELEESDWQAMLSEPERAMIGQPGVRELLILPMLGQDRLVGVVYMGFCEPLSEPVEDQLDWAQTLVNQAAAASANAQLYQRLEKQAAELSRAYGELQEVDRLRAQLVQNVGHELRTPLSLIKGYVELLLAGDLGRIRDNQQAALQVIRERTATLSRLINNLMMLQAVPREALALAPVSVTDVVKCVLEEFRRSAEEAGFVFEEELPPGLPPVWADRERLELAFGHLVDNAIKFSPDGGVITLRAWADDEMVCVSVSDEGIGIPSEYVGRIFERFYQVDGSTKRRYGGMGIGLALVWEIVEVHGGTVRVESTPGEGSVFTVVLPRMETSRQADSTSAEDGE